MIVPVFFFLQALLDLSINRQVFRLPWENQVWRRHAVQQRTGYLEIELMAVLLSSAGFQFLSPRCSYRHMPVRGEVQDMKDIAIFTMALVPFRTSTGRVLRFNYCNISNGRVKVAPLQCQGEIQHTALTVLLTQSVGSKQ